MRGLATRLTRDGLEWLDRQSTMVLMTISVLSVVLLGALDYLTGWQLSFSVFYLLPVGLASWFVSRSRGVLVAVLSAVVWFAADLAAGLPYVHPLIPWWNTAARIALFAALALILSALRRSLLHERELARIDPLTGLRNRRAFRELAELQMQRLARYGLPLTMAYVDLDDFKAVNDQRGHRAGDDLLVSVAQTLERNLRAVDVVARLGGDEFAILLPQTGPDQAQVALRRIRTKLLELAERESWPITFSIGVVTCPGEPYAVNHLLDRADELMYSVKRNGKNSIEYAVLPVHPHPAGASALN